MAGRFRWQSTAWCVVLLVGAGSARAQTEPGLTTVDPSAHGVTLPPEAAPRETPSRGSTHVYDAYRVHAESMRSQRMASGVGSLVVGGALLGTGIAAQELWNAEYGTVLIVFGAIGAGGGLLTLVFPTEVERVADANGVSFVRDPSAEQEAKLEEEWGKLASKARTGRHIGAGISFTFSAAALVAGIVVVASDGIDEETQRWLGPTLLASGGAFAAGGITALMLETQTESSYRAFVATRGKTAGATTSPVPRLRLSAAPLRDGGFFSLSTDF